MQLICNKYEHPLFLYAKNIKYGKNAEYYIPPPGLPAAGWPGGVKNKICKICKIMKNMQNLQNIKFMGRYAFVTFSIPSTLATSGSMCRSTQQ
jgi:hypothetical protein